MHGGEADPRIDLAGPPGRPDLHSRAAGRIRKVLVTPGRRGQGHGFTDAIARVDPIFAATQFGSIVLTKAILGIGIAGIGQRIELAVMVFDFDQPGDRLLSLMEA